MMSELVLLRFNNIDKNQWVELCARPQRPDRRGLGYAEQAVTQGPPDLSFFSRRTWQAAVASVTKQARKGINGLHIDNKATLSPPCPHLKLPR
jgi:hypothetical protein